MQAHLEAQPVAAGDGDKFVIEFKARFVRKTIDAGSIREEIEIELTVLATSLGKGAQRFPGNNNGSFAAVLKDFRHSLGIP